MAAVGELESHFQTLLQDIHEFGILPLNFLPDGTVQFRLLSRCVLHYGIFCFLFTICSVYFVPMYHNFLLPLKDQSKLDYVSKLTFALSFYISSLLSTVLVVPTAFNFRFLWNDFNSVTSYFQREGYAGRFEKPCRNGKWAVASFLCTAGLMTVLGTVLLKPFNVHDTLSQITICEWINLLSFFIFVSLTVVQFFVSLVVSYLCYFAGFCFNLLLERAQCFRTDSNKDEDIKKFDEGIILCLRTFKILNELVDKISRCYGPYLLFTILALLIVTLMSVIAIFSASQHENIDHKIYYLCILAYIIWLAVLCEGAERLNNSVFSSSSLNRNAKLCQDGIRDTLGSGSPWVGFLFLCPWGNVYSGFEFLIQMHMFICCLQKNEKLLHVVIGMKTAKLSASHFFVIRRRLITSIFGTFATYAIVMVQMRFKDVEEIF